VSKGIYAMLTNADSKVVKQASRELKMNKYVVEEYKNMPAEIASFLIQVDNPTVYIPQEFVDLDARIPEVVKPGSYKGFLVIVY
jgi:hypothetical protein